MMRRDHIAGDTECSSLHREMWKRFSKLNQSNVHGFALIFYQSRHIVERLFWKSVVCTFAICVVEISRGQWQRYQMHPTMISLETNYGDWMYRYPAVTMCSNYTDAHTTIDVVQSVWNISGDDDAFPMVKAFAETVATTTWFNLDNFARFANDSELFKDVDMRRLAFVMRGKLTKYPNGIYTNVMTEFGVCFSTTNLFRFQNPFGWSGDQIEPKSEKKTCRLADSCELRIAPHDNDAGHLIVLLHDVNDVITGTATNTLRRDLIDDRMFFMKINIHETVSSRQLRSLAANRRKCYFHDETPLKYFDFYTENLCRIECRIDAAIEHCSCIPFFYSVESAYDMCDVQGLQCLALANWYNDTCQCYPSCDSISYTKMEYTQVAFDKFSKSIFVTMILPKKRMKRNVLFTGEDLLVSFGGAAALFLGFSILSAVEIIYLLFQ